MSTLINKAISTTLNSSTYTEIKAGSQDLYGFGLFVQDSGELASFYLAWDSDGEGATLIPAIGIGYGDFQPKGSTICWVKAVSGTPTLTVLPSRYSAYK